jgi:hypothetical protein
MVEINFDTVTTFSNNSSMSAMKTVVGWSELADPDQVAIRRPEQGQSWTI